MYFLCQSSLVGAILPASIEAESPPRLGIDRIVQVIVHSGIQAAFTVTAHSVWGLRLLNPLGERAPALQ